MYSCENVLDNIDYPTYSAHQVTFKKDGVGINISGTSNDITLYDFYYGAFPAWLETDREYQVQFDNNNSNIIFQIYCYDENSFGEAVYNSFGSGKVVFPSAYNATIRFRIRIKASGVYVNKTFYPSIVRALTNAELTDKTMQNIVDPDNYSGTDSEKITAAMNAIGDSNHGIILIRRQYNLTENILVKHLGNANARMIFMGIGGNNPGFNMGSYGFVRYDATKSYGALSFENILFKATNIMFSIDNIIRVNFENCVFDGFDHVIYCTRFLQTYYFNDCLFRNGTGTAIVGTGTAPLIDLRFDHCLVETSTHFIDAYSLDGVHITSCCIEGNDGYVINVTGACYDVVIDNCYFEAQNVGRLGGTDGNGMCFDFHAITGIVHSVSITNNFFGGLNPGNKIISLPYRMMEDTVFTIVNNWLSPAISSDPNVESGAYLVSVPNNAVNVYRNLRYDQNVRAKKDDPNHLIIDRKESNTDVAALLVTEYYMSHDDNGNPTTRFNPGYWYVCDDLNDLYAPGYYHISANIPIAHSPVNTDFYLINMRTNETVVQIAITSTGMLSRIGTGAWH